LIAVVAVLHVLVDETVSTVRGFTTGRTCVRIILVPVVAFLYAVLQEAISTERGLAEHGNALVRIVIVSVVALLYAVLQMPITAVGELTVDAIVLVVVVAIVALLTGIDVPVSAVRISVPVTVAVPVAVAVSVSVAIAVPVTISVSVSVSVSVSIAVPRLLSTPHSTGGSERRHLVVAAVIRKATREAEKRHRIKTNQGPLPHEDKLAEASPAVTSPRVARLFCSTPADRRPRKSRANLVSMRRPEAAPG
jgi:hypothetical protein